MPILPKVRKLRVRSHRALPHQPPATVNRVARPHGRAADGQATERWADEGGSTPLSKLGGDELVPPIQGPKKLHRILLVEDNDDLAEVMARLLSRHGYEVEIADTVARAEQLAATQPFDLLISDLGLPDGSGLDLVRHLRARHPWLAIALSGHGTNEDIRQSKEAGFAAHLSKPVSLEVLEETIVLLGVDRLP